VASPSLGAKDFLKILCKVVSSRVKPEVDGGEVVPETYIKLISGLKRVGGGLEVVPKTYIKLISGFEKSMLIMKLLDQSLISSQYSKQSQQLRWHTSSHCLLHLTGRRHVHECSVQTLVDPRLFVVIYFCYEFVYNTYLIET
jgi:hypothetical protein